MISKLKSDQVYHLLYNKIVKGDLAPGSRIPAETKLAAQLGVGRKTLRTALGRLEDQKLLIRMRKSGTFVADLNGTSPDPEILLSTPAPQKNIKHKFLIINTPKGSPYSLTEYLREYAAECGIETMEVDIYFFHTSELEERFHWLSDQHFTGIILTAHTISPDDPVLQIQDKLHLPVIMPAAWETDMAITPFFMIPLSPRLIFMKAVNYFFKEGHRRFAFLTMNWKESPDDFYNISDMELQLLTQQKHILRRSACENVESIEAAIEYFLQQEERPTALICYNAYFAVIAAEYLKKRGIRIPDDISLIGFGHRKECEYATPAIPALSLSFPERCRAAIDFLIAGDYRHEVVPQISSVIIAPESIKKIFHS
ncbi:MAG: GntR family transcriptional regulator [Lentisphaeria bacterium]|nr:GntR family transcriptional regulator [Lentisphaeria bacterium]